MLETEPMTTAPFQGPLVVDGLTPEELAQLGEESEAAGLDPAVTAERIIRRALIKSQKSGRPTVGAQSNQARALTRAARQLRLSRYVEQHGFPQGELMKRALAKQLGVDQRTLYRDLDALALVLGDPKTTRLHKPKGIRPRNRQPVGAPPAATPAEPTTLADPPEDAPSQVPLPH